jgi:hypothetical protein
MSTESILQEAERIINGDRRSDYGKALDSFNKIAEGWAMVLGHPVTPEQVALCMVQLKVARWLNGQQRDSLVDICGYVGCIEQVQQERERRGDPAFSVTFPWTATGADSAADAVIFVFDSGSDDHEDKEE